MRTLPMLMAGMTAYRLDADPVLYLSLTCPSARNKLLSCTSKEAVFENTINAERRAAIFVIVDKDYRPEHSQLDHLYFSFSSLFMKNIIAGPPAWSEGLLRGVALTGIALALTLLMVAGKSMAVGNGNGIEVVTPRIVNAHTGPVYWVTIFVNAPIHNAPAGTYQKNAVPLQYSLTWGVCQNRITTVRVVGRYDTTGGKQTTLEGTNANWQNVYSKVVESGVCPVGTPAASDGAIQCFQYQNFSDTLNLSNLSPGACSTTLQMVAKAGVSGPGLPVDVPPPPTDDSLLRTDPSISSGFAHGVNLWLNFCEPSTSSSSSLSSSMSSSSSYSSSAQSQYSHPSSQSSYSSQPTCPWCGTSSAMSYPSSSAHSSVYSQPTGCNTCGGGVPWGRNHRQWGWGQMANVWNNANTTVNNQVNALSQNNTAIWQGGGGFQKAFAAPTANTTVNNQVNAGSVNNVWVQQRNWGW